MEGTMKPRTLIVIAGLAAVALAVPAEAQSARVTVGAVVSIGSPYPAPDRYPQQWPPYAGRPGSVRYDAREVALNRGFNDGYEQGLAAARHRERYDPWRERWYRGAERGYDRDYRMERNDYRDTYRRGFLRGYEAGYRDGRRGGYGRSGDWRNDRDGRQPQGGWGRNW
jgi:hypothetical protein